jgi:hypothetical protein
MVIPGYKSFLQLSRDASLIPVGGWPVQAGVAWMGIFCLTSHRPMGE